MHYIFVIDQPELAAWRERGERRSIASSS